MEIPAVGSGYTNTHAQKPYLVQEATQAENSWRLAKYQIYLSNSSFLMDIATVEDRTVEEMVGKFAIY